MVVHIVMWKIKPDADGKGNSGNCGKVKKLLEDLKNIIPEIESLSVGIQAFPDPGAWDVVLHSIFADHDSLIAYQNHPDHVSAAQIIGGLRTERAVVDYEV